MASTITKLDLDRIKVQIMRDHAFYGALLHTINWVASDQVPTAGIDGNNNLYINPAFFNAQPEKQKISIACHEILHGCFFHYDRIFKNMAKEDKMLANFAADYLINFMIKESGMEIGDGWLYNPEYHPDKYTMETLMEVLRKDKKTMDKIKQLTEGPGNYGHGGDADAGGGNDMVFGKEKMTPKEMREAEQNMKMALSSAVMIAKKRGNLPSCIERMVDEMVKPKQNWKAELHEWFNVKIKDLTTWNRPNRRFVHQRKIFPSKYSVGCGHIGVSIDVSGSIGSHELAIFESELNCIFEHCKPSKITVVYFDTSIKEVSEFEEFPIKLKAVGGGGTDFDCAFSHFNNLDDRITGLVFMTDMYGTWPEAPDYPVCILSTSPKMVAPFGVTIYADMNATDE